MEDFWKPQFKFFRQLEVTASSLSNVQYIANVLTTMTHSVAWSAYFTPVVRED